MCSSVAGERLLRFDRDGAALQAARRHFRVGEHLQRMEAADLRALLRACARTESSAAPLQWTNECFQRTDNSEQDS